MHPTLTRRLLWLAIWLAWCNALAPTALRLASTASGGQVVTLCSALNSKQVRIDPATGEEAPVPADLKHCPFCLASQLACLPPGECAVSEAISGASAIASPRADEYSANPALRHVVQPRAPPQVMLS